MPRVFDSPPYSRIMSAACAAGVFAPRLAARSRAAALGDRLTLAVAGQGEMYHLPVLLAEQLGFFKAEGLDVVLRDFSAGALALQALQDGSVDVVSGSYEHTIRQQLKWIRIALGGAARTGATDCAGHSAAHAAPV